MRDSRTVVSHDAHEVRLGAALTVPGPQSIVGIAPNSPLCGVASIYRANTGAVRQTGGISVIVSGLKTLLVTGEPLRIESPQPAEATV